MNFRCGDKIKVVCAGEVYSSWSNKAKELGATNYQLGRGRDSGHLKNGMEGIITGIDITHRHWPYFLIRMDDGFDYLINKDGIEPIQSQPLKKVIKEYPVVKWLKEH